MSPRHIERIATPHRVALILALPGAGRRLASLAPLPDAMAVDASACAAWRLADLHTCEGMGDDDGTRERGSDGRGGRA